MKVEFIIQKALGEARPVRSKSIHVAEWGGLEWTGIEGQWEARQQYTLSQGGG